MDAGFVDQRRCLPRERPGEAKSGQPAGPGCWNIAGPSVPVLIRRPSASAKASGWSEWDSPVANQDSGRSLGKQNDIQGDDLSLLRAGSRFPALRSPGECRLRLLNTGACVKGLKDEVPRTPKLFSLPSVCLLALIEHAPLQVCTVRAIGKGPGRDAEKKLSYRALPMSLRSPQVWA